MKVLSLFDGISCARVALERAGIPVEAYYASEIDKYAIQVAMKNYPDTVQVGSVVGLDGAQFTDIGLLIGGSPCQDLSIAKKDRKGLDGSRSGLFWEYVRILREVKPKWFILENVASMPKEAKAQMLSALQEVVPETEVHMIDAALVSAQRRKRYFFTNIPNITQPEDRGILLKDILEDGEMVMNPKLLNFKGDTEKCMTLTSSMYKEPPIVLSKAYCVPSTYYKENVKSLVQRKKVGLFITEKNPQTGSIQSNCKNYSSIPEKEFIRKLTPIECERLQSLPDNYTEGVSNTQRYKALGNAFNVEVVAHILSFIKP